MPQGFPLCLPDAGHGALWAAGGVQGGVPTPRTDLALTKCPILLNATAGQHVVTVSRPSGGESARVCRNKGHSARGLRPSAAL